MRESKFRGFNRKNGVWLYGFYLQNRGAHFVCPDEFAEGKSWDDYEIDPETRGEYTGQKDKNGREIYEGDVVRRTEVYNRVWATVAIVCYRQETVQFVLHNDEEYVEDQPLVSTRNYDDGQISFVLEYEYEVIGNIHDNPELLEQ